jgi:glutamyl-tRNA synthetase
MIAKKCMSMDHQYSNKPTRTRIAPSPTGFPHVGTAYQSLFDYVWAKKHGGQFVFRLEDTDRARLVEGAAENLYAMMRWVGIPYDEGPDVGGPYAPYVQSERLEIYKPYAKQLVMQGNAYYCFCAPERLIAMRAEQEKNHQPPKYDRHCANLDVTEVANRLAKGELAVIRMRVPEGQTRFVDRVMGEIVFENNEIDDQVLLKSDGYPTYHLGVVVDDNLMKITDVIRGTEWISSTPKHVLLYQFFGWDLPTFSHIPLLLNKDKSKLSKRKNDVSILSYKQQGYLPEALINYLAQQGWSHPEGKDIYSIEEMISLFSWDRVPKTGSIFDFDKLQWFNGQYMRAMSLEQVAERLVEHSAHPLDEIKRVLPLVHDRLVLLSEFDHLVAFLFGVEEYDKQLLISKNQTAESTKIALSAVAESLAALEIWGQESWEAAIRSVAEKLGWKAGELFMSLRVAVTFTTTSPPLRESMELLGREVSLSRIEQAAYKLS